MSEQDTMTFDEAVTFLPSGDDVHTFMNPAGMLVGADWTREDVLAAMRDAPEILITGTSAQAMKHGLAIQLSDDGSKTLFIETTRRTDELGVG